MFSISKISNFAGAVVLIFAIKMFFFTAFFAVADTNNIPQNIYEYSHQHYSSTEKLKRIREINFDEWLNANGHSESNKSLRKINFKLDYSSQFCQLFSYDNFIENKIESNCFYQKQNPSALLNDRPYLRFQKLLL